jgi:hypothetical protein
LIERWNEMKGENGQKKKKKRILRISNNKKRRKERIGWAYTI